MLVSTRNYPNLPRLPHAACVFAHTFTDAQLRTLGYLRALLHPTSAIVAGGWVRDVISGHEPHDIDVFIASSEFEHTLAGLRKDPALTISELLQDTIGDDERSSGEHVEQVWQVTGTDCGCLQFISVADPRAWVPLFDAHCNMLYVPLGGVRFNVIAVSPLAVAHAKTRVWEVSPAAQESNAVLMRRADKFEDRGFEVRRKPIERAS